MTVFLIKIIACISMFLDHYKYFADDDEQKNHEETEHKEKKAPILSPFGELGTEELLLIALALIVFGSGKEPDLALILLALLFIN